METLFEESKRCRYCDSIVKGRSDKLDCNIQHKNAYHNPRNKIKRLVYKDGDYQLHRNHIVLEKFFEMSKGELFIDQKPLILEGFNSRFYLGTLTDKTTGESLYVIYNYGFVINRSSQIKIYFKNGGFHTL